MKLIPLSQGQFTKVDDADFDWLNQFKWYAQKEKGTYSANRDERVNGKKVNHRMHRDILKLLPGEFCDHIDRDRLNNQRTNLRKCTVTENNRNRRKPKRAAATSKYLGVSWDFNKWRATIYVNKKAIILGKFTDEVSAAKAYNIGAQKYFGEFANLNRI